MLSFFYSSNCKYYVVVVVHIEPFSRPRPIISINATKQFHITDMCMVGEQYILLYRKHGISFYKHNVCAH